MTSSLAYPSVVDRYFTRLFVCDVAGKQNEDICLMFHSNNVCALTLAPGHPILREKKSVESVDFKVTEKTDRLQNKVSGKAKKGCQFLTALSPVCIIKCSDETRFIVRGCLNSKLLEMNVNLLQNPNLLVEKPETNGYIALISPSLKNTLTQLLTLEKYRKVREKMPTIEHQANKFKITSEKEEIQENLTVDDPSNENVRKIEKLIDVKDSLVSLA